MTSVRSELVITIEFKDIDFAQVAFKSLEPENNQIDANSSIQMSLEGQKLLIEFSSTSSLSSIRNTVDDILSTINTSESIYKTVKSS
jgi:tRNA threonylcarbamoyladenosine modification (KEOPS) complex  Pcc1 subunit